MASVIRGSGASTLGGALDVQGVLTYEDVTSVDSIGIITARSGIIVGTGASIFSPDTNELTLGTNNIERLRIESGGNITATSRVDVGGLTADSNLTPTSGTSIEIFYGGSGGVIQTFDRDNGNTEPLRVRGSNWDIGYDGSVSFAGGGFAIDADGEISTNVKSAGHIELDSAGTFTSPKIKLFSNTGNATFAGNVATSGFSLSNVTGNIGGTGGVGANDIYIGNGSSNKYLRVITGGTGAGNVSISGAISKGSGSFKIDHPLPAKTETHHLVHSFIEGPQADLIYRGYVDLVDGQATVNIDTAGRMTEGTFEVLCTNVSCFTSNESDWTTVKGSVTGNVLTITAQDNTSTSKVSWMVVGERKDQHMIDTDWTDSNGRVITEPSKESS